MEVQDFIWDQVEPERSILEYLHGLISSYPGVITKIRYRVPFYYKHSWFCYLNPQKKGGIELVFIRGNEMVDETGLLQANGRKQVRGIIFKHLKDIPEEAIHQIISEALVLDETIPYASKRKKKP